MSMDTSDRAETVDWLRGQLHWEGRLHELWRAGGVPPSPEPPDGGHADAAPAPVAATAR